MYYLQIIISSCEDKNRQRLVMTKLETKLKIEKLQNIIWKNSWGSIYYGDVPQLSEKAFSIKRNDERKSSPTKHLFMILLQINMNYLYK